MNSNPGKGLAPRSSRLAALLLLIAVPVLARPIEAGSSGAGPHSRVTLLSEGQSIRPGQSFRVGLLVQLERGWHTYWKNPGDSGLPLSVDWRLPEGFSAAPIDWPAPSRISAPPLLSYGYGGEVLLPVVITPPARIETRTVRIAGAVDWLECKEICLPAEATVELALPVQTEPPVPSASAPRFARALEARPGNAEAFRPRARLHERVISLSFDPPAKTAVGRAEFFADQPLILDYAAAQTLKRQGDGYRLDLALDPNAAEAPDSLTGVLIVNAGPAQRRALDIQVPVERGDGRSAAGGIGATTAAHRGPSLSWPLALAFAFLGGLLLNLMPCVLPVLSIKVLGLVQAPGGGPAWRHGVAFTAGVLASFWILAAAMLALRAGGEQIGWGFQLQSAPFLACLSALFLLIGMNFFGVFEVGASWTGAGRFAARRPLGTSGAFWNGVLATLVATPCTAPFMGSALGFALVQPPLPALGLFTALALGMATPYLVLTLRPRLLRFVPKAGPWMITLKQGMGLAMLATVAALVWLFGQQTGVNGIGLLLGALVAVSFAGWIYGRVQGSTQARGLRWAGQGFALLLLVAGLGVGLRASGARDPAGGAVDRGRPTGTPSTNPSDWEPFSLERLQALRADGTPTFIDFTAAWCLTCQVNERVALADASVRERFRREGIVTLRADWTRRDDQITGALASYGRQGVPVYVLYGRGPNGPPRLLPELLTPGIILTALDETLGFPDAEARAEGTLSSITEGP